MKFKTTFIVPVVLAVAVLGLLFLPIPDRTQATSGVHPVKGWAWSSNIGWIKFGPEAGGSTFDYSTLKFSGYAWSSNIGWIKLDPLVLGPATVSSLADGAKVTGWMRALAPQGKADSARGGWDGKLSMSDPSTANKYAVTLKRTSSRDEFRGFAWGDIVLGWVNFDQVYIDPTPCTPGTPGCVEVPSCVDGEDCPEVCDGRDNDGDDQIDEGLNCDDEDTGPWTGQCTVSDSSVSVGDTVSWNVNLSGGVLPYEIQVKMGDQVVKDGVKMTQAGIYTYSRTFVSPGTYKPVITVTDGRTPVPQTDSTGDKCPSVVVVDDIYRFTISSLGNKILRVNKPPHRNYNSTSVTMVVARAPGNQATAKPVTIRFEQLPQINGFDQPVSYINDSAASSIRLPGGEGSFTYYLRFPNRAVDPYNANIASPYNGVWTIKATGRADGQTEEATYDLDLDYFDDRETSI